MSGGVVFVSGVCEWYLQTKSLAGPAACVLRSGSQWTNFKLHFNSILTC